MLKDTAEFSITTVYTFPVASIRVQIIGKDTIVVKGATKVEEVKNPQGGELILKDENDKIVGKFKPAQVAGWWIEE